MTIRHDGAEDGRATAGKGWWLALLGLGLVVAGWWALPVAAAEPVAAVDGVAITQAELEAAAAAELQQLDRQRHQLLEATLERLLDERLLAAAAARRGTTAERLLADTLAARGGAVTDQEVDAWYVANQARVRQPKEAVADRIREHLQQQRADTVRGELLAELRGQHQVKVYFEPLRLPVDDPRAPSQGAQQAPITVVEFSDFQCPYCQRILPALEEARQKYGDKLRVVFRQFPLHAIHPDAQKAAEAALCAADQGKFWPMHDVLFARQSELGVDQLKGRAAELKLDTERFNRCLDSGEQEAKVAADLQAGQQAGVPGTPAFFVNGRPLNLVAGVPPFEQLAALIDDELARLGSR